MSIHRSPYMDLCARFEDAKRALERATGIKGASLEEAVERAADAIKIANDALDAARLKVDPATVDWSKFALPAQTFGVDDCARILARTFGLDLADTRLRLIEAEGLARPDTPRLRVVPPAPPVQWTKP